MIAAKEQVWENEKAKYTKKSNLPEVTKSWHNYMVKVSKYSEDNSYQIVAWFIV